MILALSFLRNRNVGDRWSSPAHYFDLGDEVVHADPGDPAPPNADAVLFGGGTMARWIPAARNLPAVPWIAWGVGYTERGRLGRHGDRVHAAAARLCVAYGNRDWGSDVGSWVPCASCMHPAFDRAYSIEHDVVFYGHAQLNPLTDAPGPRLTNDVLDMDRVIAFLASGDTIVTSSYHGAYWGLLLGRRVIVLPFGSKFFHLPWQPLLVNDREKGVQMAKAGLAAAYPYALDEARTMTRFWSSLVRGALDAR